jgi:hypothetical protein
LPSSNPQYLILKLFTRSKRWNPRGGICAVYPGFDESIQPSKQKTLITDCNQVEATSMLSTEVGKLREQHRHALLLIAKYEKVIRILCQKASIAVDGDGLPDVGSLLDEATPAATGQAPAPASAHAASNGGVVVSKRAPVGLLSGHVCYEDPPLSVLYGAEKGEKPAENFLISEP